MLLKNSFWAKVVGTPTVCSQIRKVIAIAVERYH